MDRALARNAAAIHGYCRASSPPPAPVMDILASDTDIDAQTYQQMRGKSYQEVLRTNGQISFPEVLRQHSRW